MFSVRPFPQFTAWLNDLPYNKVRGAVLARIERLRQGLFGDCKSVGDGVSELRIRLGTGWRVYFTQHERQIIILLIGGSKRTQAKDIKRARALAAALN